MSLPSEQFIMTNMLLTKYCAKKVPMKYRDKVRVLFKIRGNSVTLYEERPAFFEKNEWVDIKVAQFRYNPKNNKWQLYCADRNSRWHIYYEIDSTPDLNKLLVEVEEDPTGIFWG